MLSFRISYVKCFQKSPIWILIENALYLDKFGKSWHHWAFPWFINQLILPFFKFVNNSFNFFHKYIRHTLFYQFLDMIYIFCKLHFIFIYFNISISILFYLLQYFWMLFLLPGTSFPKDTAQVSPPLWSLPRHLGWSPEQK